MSSKFAIENENVLQLLGGSAPGPCCGTSVPQTPSSLVQFKDFLKKALMSAEGADNIGHGVGWVETVYQLKAGPRADAPTSTLVRLSVCLSVCLPVRRITEKVVNGF